MIFAPIKKTRTDFIVKKVTELGVSEIVPVGTDWTNAAHIRRDRLQAHAIEAAAQCGGLYGPPVQEMQKLEQLLVHWPESRKILFCNEEMQGRRFTDLDALPAGVWAILIGPEGGCSLQERVMLEARNYGVPVSLGPRISRADTAAVAAIALWQANLGDWL